ncbi:cobyrinate a,c-diamide synthase [Chelatococcus reniformis]|uniref:Hydrogenobyrinate a,c-diamide synthase n=1 Tax=Chelatococcus reniformis TaxID=1494448 RepID=A0A916XM98_9HYPH|nr:cobyrinate a,c-diamide synthase [Chelatococcus reniformis]GGC86068.1 hydrogenobyrinate a,c-diamide synthase [Chelatococcus reniformis]
MTAAAALPRARGILVSAPRSGAGKTTVTLGLLTAFAARGLTVQAVKTGPDYIDPAFHAAATGRPGLNLDTWAMPAPLVDALADEAAGADLVIAEGAMGLFDGIPGRPGRSGAPADVAARLGLPVVLVLDVSGQSQSAAAVARGFSGYDPAVRIAGVVLNKAGSERHIRLVSDAMRALAMPVLGAIPRDAGLSLPERHLGLVQAVEHADLAERLSQLRAVAERHLDLDAILALAVSLPDFAQPAAVVPLPPPGQRIALASDAAFGFVYPHVLAGWRRAGAEVVPFSPLADEPPPDRCDACWLPGGYPELHAAQLAAAGRFRTGVRRFAETRPVHGECGGYMVLGQALADADGTTHAMLGLLGHSTSYARRKLNLGYREATLRAAGVLGPAGAVVRGHEFHYAVVADPGADEPMADLLDGEGRPLGPAGGRRGQVSGTFFHAIATA